jgi:hypothetical protein
MLVLKEIDCASAVRFKNVCSAALAGAALLVETADVFELKKSK